MENANENDDLLAFIHTRRVNKRETSTSLAVSIVSNYLNDDGLNIAASDEKFNLIEFWSNYKNEF